MNSKLLELARQSMQLALKKGADQAAVGVGRSRYVSVEWRNGRLENVEESTTCGLTLRLYLDQRYSSHNTSDLRPAALESFISAAVEMTRPLEPDPHRRLPEPELYRDRPDKDLKIHDPAQASLDPGHRLDKAESLEQAARDAAGEDASKIISVTAGSYDTMGESARVHSNGFEGSRESTSFWLWAECSVQDVGDKRPEGWASAGSRLLCDLPEVGRVGSPVIRRALDLIGARPISSRRTEVLVENRVAGRLAGMLLGSPLSAWALQQKRSYLEGRLGEKIGSHLLSVVDQPLLESGFGSRLYDGEGISARPLTIIEKGILKNYYIDTYYGRKLGMPPTTGSISNLDWTLGDRDQEAMLKDLAEGVLVTSFLGGNSNDTTGDFSVGIRGFYVKNGKREHPIAEMNITGNHLDIWKRLVEVGSEPYPYSSYRCPALLFDDLQLSGT